MRYANSKWHSAHEAIIKSSIAVPKDCQMGSHEAKDYDWLKTPGDYEIPDLPKEILLPSGQAIAVTPNTLTYDFTLNEEEGIDCYLQFFIKCNKIFKTAGMGDTISSTGWIYHVPKNS